MHSKPVIVIAKVCEQQIPNFLLTFLWIVSGLNRFLITSLCLSDEGRENLFKLFWSSTSRLAKNLEIFVLTIYLKHNDDELFPFGWDYCEERQVQGFQSFLISILMFILQHVTSLSWLRVKKTELNFYALVLMSCLTIIILHLFIRTLMAYKYLCIKPK